MSVNYPQLYKYHKIQFKQLDMAAILMYCVRQTKHIDTPHLMDLQDPNLANSSLYMINACVNASEIEYDQNSDTLHVKYPLTQSKPKVICLENADRPCNNGNTKNKHLYAYTHSVVMAISPDVAMCAHQVHDVNGWTIVFTNRGLSKRRKKEAESLNVLLSNYEIH